MKRIFGFAATFLPVRLLARVLLRDHAVIFMAHRFACPENQELGHDPVMLRKALAFLRGERVRIVSLQEIADVVAEGGDLSGMVAFTVDDGYSDFHDVAAPIFRAFECPVTVFPVTGFLDGELWFWWDQLRHLLMNTERKGVEVEVGTRTLALRLDDKPSRLQAVRLLRPDLARMGIPSRERTLARLEEHLGVSLPSLAPNTFRPLTWDQVRSLEGEGFTFGPHTVHHENLAALSPEEAGQEVVESWDRLRSETRAAIPVFCFPYGAAWSLAPWAGDLARGAGLRAAVTAQERHVSGRGDTRDSPFLLPRMGWPDTLAEVRHIARGLARLREVVSPR